MKRMQSYTSKNIYLVVMSDCIQLCLWNQNCFVCMEMIIKVLAVNIISFIDMLLYLLTYNIHTRCSLP